LHSRIHSLPAASATLRLLAPFTVPRRNIDAAVQALSSHDTASGTAYWMSSVPHFLYLDEIDSQVAEMLFLGSGEGKLTAPHYFTAPRALEERWMSSSHIDLLNGRQTQVDAHPKHGLELFLTAHGIGVLSLALQLKKGTTFAEILDLSHALAQHYRRRAPAAYFVKRDPTEDAAIWARLPPSQREQIEHARSRSQDPDLETRIGAPGSRFALQEFFALLLKPLAPLELALDQTLAIYSVVRLTHGALPDARAERSGLLSFASGLAQGEKSTHAGAEPDESPARVAVLNRNHLCATTSQGAAHVLVDQPEMPFNEERAIRVHFKYFVPYLVALVGRTGARSLSRRALSVVAEQEGGSASHLVEVRRDLLKFSFVGLPFETSSRQSVNRYFSLCNVALGSDRAIEQLNAATGRLESFLSAARQEELSRRVVVASESMQKMQTNLEWVEIFIVFIYSNELLHAFAELGLLGRHFHLQPLAQIGLATVISLLVALLLKPWREH
jgi:hypothetical protein